MVFFGEENVFFRTKSMIIKSKETDCGLHAFKLGSGSYGDVRSNYNGPYALKKRLNAPPWGMPMSRTDGCLASRADVTQSYFFSFFIYIYILNT